jgi:hypothetical protein
MEETPTVDGMAASPPSASSTATAMKPAWQLIGGVVQTPPGVAKNKKTDESSSEYDSLSSEDGSDFDFTDTLHWCRGEEEKKAERTKRMVEAWAEEYAEEVKKRRATAEGFRPAFVLAVETPLGYVKLEELEEAERAERSAAAAKKTT